MAKLIVGLGNPGVKYTYTRHNLGFLSVAALASQYETKFRKVEGISGLVSSANIDGQQCSLLMPTTYMNISGVAVKQLAAKKGIDPADILVICDDLSLPYGQMRIRPSGTAGGHNGLKSIIEHLGVKDFARLRLGINAAKPGMDTADYVLENFTSGEKKLLPDFITASLLCVHCWVTGGVAKAMNEYNGKNQKEG